MFSTWVFTDPSILLFLGIIGTQRTGTVSSLVRWHISIKHFKQEEKSNENAKML